MKKAKIMLLAIAIVAVAGGALAFKAKSSKYFKPLFCATISTVTAGSPDCPVGYTTVNGATPLFCTDTPGAPCTFFTTVTTVEP